MLLMDLAHQASAYITALKAAIPPDSIVRDAYYLARTLAIGYALVLPFQLIWTHRASQKILRQGCFTDLCHAILTKLIGKYLVFLIGASFLFALLDQHLPLDGLRGVIRSQPIWVQAIQVLLLRDFIGYWTHRWMHEVPFLWRFHACHHSSEQLDPLATVRVHPVQMLFNGVIGGVLPFALGFSVGSVAIVFTVLAYWGYFGHANIAVPPNSFAYHVLKPLRWVFVTPRFHHWHHSYHVHDINYGVSFSFWDRLFGTAHLPDNHVWPERYGIPDPFPQTWPAQILHPLLPRRWQEKLAAIENRLKQPPREPATVGLSK